MKVQGLGFRVKGLGVDGLGLGFRVNEFEGLKVSDFGFRV